MAMKISRAFLHFIDKYYWVAEIAIFLCSFVGLTLNTSNGPYLVAESISHEIDDRAASVVVENLTFPNFDFGFNKIEELNQNHRAIRFMGTSSFSDPVEAFINGQNFLITDFVFDSFHSIYVSSAECYLISGVYHEPDKKLSESNNCIYLSINIYDQFLKMFDFGEIIGSEVTLFSQKYIVGGIFSSANDKDYSFAVCNEYEFPCIVIGKNNLFPINGLNINLRGESSLAQRKNALVEALAVTSAYSTGSPDIFMASIDSTNFSRFESMSHLLSQTFSFFNSISALALSSIFLAIAAVLAVGAALYIIYSASCRRKIFKRRTVLILLLAVAFCSVISQGKYYFNYLPIFPVLPTFYGYLFVFLLPYFALAVAQIKILKTDFTFRRSKPVYVKHKSVSIK